MQKALKTNLAATIPEDRNAVLEALNSGKPLPKVAPHSKAVTALRELAKSFDKDVAKPTGFFARLLGRGPSTAAKEPKKK
jgi:Flp pilus assembly CpaE family ATPase